MKVIYLILAQAYPEQLHRLVEALNDSNAVFVIHIDRGQLLKTFASVFKTDERKNIYFVKDRCSTEQGGLSFVQATLNGLKYIHKEFHNSNRVVLLNGQDYPIKSREYINSYFKTKPNKIFLQNFPIQDNKSLDGGVNGSLFDEKTKQAIKFYGGSSGMSFPVWTIKIIIDFLKTHPGFLASFKDVASPDERFFQTLLLNCEINEIENNIDNQNILLVEGDKSYSHSRILNGQDMNLIMEDGSLFAGKFHPEMSLDLLMFIDNDILNIKKNIHCNNNFVKKAPDIQITGENAVLFLTDKSHKGVLENYNKLRRTSLIDRDVHLIYHNTEKRIPASLRKLDPFVFDNSILNGLGYKSITSKLVPGSNHFPLLKFYLENPHYNYYWNIEDDVRYNGQWSTFFDFFSETNVFSDFLSCNINDYQDQPSWYWWNAIGHPSKQIPQSSKVRSFNPIFRISNRALKYLHEELSGGWQGHHEVLIPTLLKNAGFLINDFGGTGKYVLPECENKFYVSPSNDEDLDSGTMRFRPSIYKKEINEKLLYHPVKSITYKKKPLSQLFRKLNRVMRSMHLLII